MNVAREIWALCLESFRIYVDRIGGIIKIEQPAEQNLGGWHRQSLSIRGPILPQSTSHQGLWMNFRIYLVNDMRSNWIINYLYCIDLHSMCVYIYTYIFVDFLMTLWSMISMETGGCKFLDIWGAICESICNWGALAFPTSVAPFWIHHSEESLPYRQLKTLKRS